MSSTGRKDVRDSEDFYASPKWVVQAVLPHLGPLKYKLIAELSAGRGAIVRELIAAGEDPDNIVAVEPTAARCIELRKLGVDVFEGTCEKFLETMQANCLNFAGFDLIPINPPFALAEGHIRIAHKLLAPSGTAAVLARTSFLASGQCRAKFRAEFPHDRVELVRRPSFTAELLDWMTDEELLTLVKETKDKKTKAVRLETLGEVKARLKQTDSCDYSWGLFGPGRGGKFVTHEESES